MRYHPQLTVLVVDDEPEILEVIAEILKLNDVVTYAASNADEAIELLKHITPDVIVSDLSMPGLNGWELFIMLRQVRSLRNTPIIALTAHALLGDREKVLKFGFDGYIPKPFDMSYLVNEIFGCMQSYAAA